MALPTNSTSSRANHRPLPEWFVVEVSPLCCSQLRYGLSNLADTSYEMRLAHYVFVGHLMTKTLVPELWLAFLQR